MPSCYFCGCSIRNGEGHRKKVLISESARVYITKRGGGSYGQTYALRTLCASCSTQLDERNKRLSWQLPVSVVVGLIGTIVAIEWPVTDYSEKSVLGSLIYMFFLFGGLGFLIYFVLKFLASSNKNYAYKNSMQEIESAAIYQEYSLENGLEDDEFSDYKESIIQVGMEFGDIGISLQGVYGLPHTLESWIFVNDEILESIPPKHYPSKGEWERHLKKRIYSKFYSIASSGDEKSKLLAFPRIKDEDDESYKVRLNNAITRSTKEIQ